MGLGSGRLIGPSGLPGFPCTGGPCCLHSVLQGFCSRNLSLNMWDAGFRFTGPAPGPAGSAVRSHVMQLLLKVAGLAMHLPRFCPRGSKRLRPSCIRQEKFSESRGWGP